MRLSVHQSALVTVNAKDMWGGNPTLQIEAGETYQFNVPAGQTWYDAWVKTTEKGFFNPLLWFSGRRVKGVKCFALCGSIGKDDNPHYFYIGSGLKSFDVPLSGDLFLFPNDAARHYRNNRGSIQVEITRLK